MSYACIRFIDNYRSLASSLDSLVEIIIDSDHKTVKNSEKEIVGDDNIDETNHSRSDDLLNIITHRGTLISDDTTIGDLKNDLTNENEILEEASHIYKSEIDLKIVRTGLPDERIFRSRKVAFPFKYFNSIKVK